MGDTAVKTEVSSPTIKTPEPTKFSKSPQRKIKPLYALDASASLSRDGKYLILTLVNQSLDEDLDCEAHLVGNGELEDGKLTILSADDERTHNDFNYPYDVSSREESIKAEGRTLRYTAPKHSVSSLVLKLK